MDHDAAVAVDGYLSPRQFAIACEIGERWVRREIQSGELTVVRSGGRIWISPAEISKRHALELTSTVVQNRTVSRLQHNARHAKVDLDRERLIADAESYLRAAGTQVTMPGEPGFEDEMPVLTVAGGVLTGTVPLTRQLPQPLPGLAPIGTPASNPAMNHDSLDALGQEG